MMKRHIHKILHSKGVQHSLFWALTYWVLIHLFTESTLDKVDYIYTLFFVFTLQSGVYAHRLFVFKYLNTNRLYIFSLLTVVCILSFASFNKLFFDHLVDYILPGYYFISYYSILDLSKFFVTIVALSTLLKMSKEWLEQEDAKNKLIIIKKEKAQVELKALMAQVNPHFLFNSLNVIYSLAIKESKQSPDAIIKLSDMLRYVIYDSNKESVKLSAEENMIHNFLGLQAYRTDENTKVTFSTDIQKDVSIAPLLFLPLIENSFKHGVKGHIGDTYVKIKLSSNDNEVCFTIQNNKGQSDALEKEGGIGLENIKNRLQLIYPDKHEFMQNENKHEFEVILKIYN